MKSSIITPVVAGLIAAFTLGACNDGANNTVDQSQDQDQNSNHGPITITPVGNSTEFPDATLTVKNMTTKLKGTDSVEITFEYGVENYELKNQTPDADQKGCANSSEGQHIHFILDNLPYVALYEPKHTFTVAVNSEHYVMSFLSRSYHESLKNPQAGVLKRFMVDGEGNITEKEVPNSPMVFYSRPKGDYLGGDTEKVLLDFYVYNATLGSDAKVSARINGQDFEIDKWQPYFIEHAPMGNLDITLQLVDNNGKSIQGDNTNVSRTSRLAQDEPMN